MSNVPYGVRCTLVDINKQMCHGEGIARGRARTALQSRWTAAALTLECHRRLHLTPRCTRAPIVAKVLRLQEVTQRRGRRHLQPVSWCHLGVRPMVNASVIFVN